MGETLRIHVFSFLFDVFQTGTGRDLVIACLTQRAWVPDSHQPPVVSGSFIAKTWKTKFYGQHEGRMSFIMEQITGKGSTEAHTEGEGTKRGLPLCLGVNKALLVQAWEGELWGPVHEASILPSNPVFGLGLQGRPHSEVPNHAWLPGSCAQ